MKRLTSMCTLGGLTIAMLAGAGCRKTDDDAYRAGVPTREAVSLHVAGAPTDGSSGANETTSSALLGAKADTYELTRLVTAAVNGGTWAVLTLVRTVVSFPSTSHTTDSATWGPYHDALSLNTWRLTVTRAQPHQFTWVFEGKDKDKGDDAFLTIISGAHTAAVDAMDDPVEGFGNGTFTIDWDKAAMLPQHDENVGVAAFTYSRLTADATVTIDVDFTGIQDSTTKEIFNAKYRYTSTPSQGGKLDYGEDKDNVPAPGNTGTAKEHFTVESRWTEDGVGRCDLQDSGGDLGTTVAHGSECWDERFDSQYRYLEYPDAQGNWGAESACTAFPTAEYSGL
jgi:hypothetical protein